jgi:putative DNA primase/helicase
MMSLGDIYLVDPKAPPFFLPGRPDECAGLDPKNIISMENGLLDITTLKLYGKTAKFFTRTALPISYDPNATCPMWMAFLFQVLGDEELVILMCQWFGYLITTDTSYQKILYLRGRPRSGKGTCGRVLDQLIGPRNITSPTIGDLAGSFGREGLEGKSLLKITDMNADDRKDLSSASTLINAISGEDPIKIPRKFKGALDIPKLAMHVVLMGNQFPNFGDHAAALADRLSVLAFNNSFAGREDDGLTAKLLTELPGILNWALAGLADLRLMGNFDKPAASERAKREVLNSGDPVRAFVNDMCEIAEAGSDFITSKDDLFDAYVGYCSTIKAHPFSKSAFFSKLKTAFHSLQDKRAGSDGERETMLVGIRLRTAHIDFVTKTFKLDAALVELFGVVCDEAIARRPDGSWIEYGTAADDFGP